MDAVKKIHLEEGLVGFLRGMEATIWRHAVWNGGYFGVIFAVKKQMPDNTLFSNFVAGLVGGTVGTALNTPFDVAKTRIQGSTGHYGWTIPKVFNIASTEG